MNELENQTTVKAKFYKRINRNPGTFCAHLCASKDFENIPSDLQPTDQSKQIYIKLIGNDLPAIEGVWVSYTGKWVRNKYGISLAVSSFSIIKPDAAKGMIRYLSSSLFPGIGKAIATKLVEKYKDSLYSMIENTPYLLDIPNSKKAVLTSVFAETKRAAELFEFLGAYDVPSRTISLIAKQLGSEAKEQILNNPYYLMRIPSIGFLTCDNIAKKLGADMRSQERVRGCVIFALKQLMQKDGHMWIGKEELVKQCLKILNEGFADPILAENNVENVIMFMKEERYPQIIVEDYEKVYLWSAYSAEKMTADKVHLLTMANVSPEEVRRCTEVVKLHKNIASYETTREQSEAILAALVNKLSIITGGPGTGKTTVILGIIECYKELYGDDITLLAPTGKAARRMTEATGCPASTIHSRLGIYDVEMENLDVIPIESGLVIVDEMSMVGGFLINKLLNAIDLKNCHVVFVGDPDQLPSVECGSVLTDMLNSGKIPSTRLSVIHRQSEDSLIIKNAIAINSYHDETKRQKLQLGEDFQFVKAESDTDAVDKVLGLYQAECETFGIENVALLTPLKRSQNGRFACVSDNLNNLIQNIVNPATEAKKSFRFDTREFRVGDRVMQTKNTPTSSNGEVGILEDIRVLETDVEFKISWENGTTDFLYKKEIENVVLAYSMSIHKSQGNEYDCVIIPIVASHKCGLFKKNLIYTAATRAKKKVIFVGDGVMLGEAMKNNDVVLRHSGLKDKIMAA